MQMDITRNDSCSHNPLMHDDIYIYFTKYTASKPILYSIFILPTKLLVHHLNFALCV